MLTVVYFSKSMLFFKKKSHDSTLKLCNVLSEYDIKRFIHCLPLLKNERDF